MKIYTKKGDKGTTSLFGGASIDKSSSRIEAYGTVDELNTIIGMVISAGTTKEGKEILNEIQKELFVLGADLATLPDKNAKIERIGKTDIERLEQRIDQLDSELPPLTSFILPGGTQAGSALHMARTVCRRAERRTVALKHQDPISNECVIYLNRLSDLLFVMARYENQKAGVTETPWMPRKKKS
ncbi:MAG: cob(I)yrinic acid a,c-diamide adenosyltransferase [Balneolaceae bacterium]|nr:cob(I)yrinic acid a,c-diamide adenosyltransferase [Balneolaceae bacterium]